MLKFNTTHLNMPVNLVGLVVSCKIPTNYVKSNQIVFTSKIIID